MEAEPAAVGGRPWEGYADFFLRPRLAPFGFLTFAAFFGAGDAAPPAPSCDFHCARSRLRSPLAAPLCLSHRNDQRGPLDGLVQPGKMQLLGTLRFCPAPPRGFFRRRSQRRLGNGDAHAGYGDGDVVAGPGAAGQEALDLACHLLAHGGGDRRRRRADDGADMGFDVLGSS